jgi:hypothetical protein
MESRMGETIEALRRVQAVELKLAGIRRERETKLHRIEAHQKAVRKIEDRFAECRRQQRELQVKIDSLQLEMASREESVAKHRAGLNKAKTNKEYAGILAAMNTEKADNLKVENEALKNMEELQELQKQADEILAEQVKAAELLAAAEEALRQYDELTRSDAAKYQRERTEAAAGVAPAVLAAFTRTAERNDGEAMAAVAKWHPKRDEYVCLGCNMTVTLEVVNTLRTKDEIRTCGVCGRILYLDSPPASKSSSARA